MANPNMINITDIRGKTSVQDISTVETSIVENDVASNKIYKINSLIVSNSNTTISFNVTVDLFRSSSSYSFASSITVPANATLVVISKETGVYLEESDAIRCKASANNQLQAICSYEEIA